MALVYTALIKAETKTAIRPSELNQLILDDIQKNYPRYSINDAFKVNNKGVITYEVIIQEGKDRLNLYYDDKGKFIRKQLPVKPKLAPLKKIRTKGKAV
jgi:hypothetical protein